jgi:hypothetical protein
MPNTDVLVDEFIEYARKSLHIENGTEESEQLERLIKNLVGGDLSKARAAMDDLDNLREIRGIYTKTLGDKE